VTIRITIKNEAAAGGQSLCVRTMFVARDIDNRTAAPEILNADTQKNASATLAPGESEEFHIWSTQSLRIDEVL
jgi:hypothetical protein